MIKVAIIDTGINGASLKSPNIIEKRYLISDTNIKQESVLKKDPPSDHGTICAQILEDTINNDIPYHLIDIDIFSIGNDNTIFSSNIQRLKKALDLCLTINVDVISMSIGSRNLSDYQIIKESIMAIYERGIIMVASGDNFNKMSIPSRFPEVFGVKYDNNKILQNGQLVYDKTNILGIQITVPLNNNKVTSCNSFAVPVFVAYLVNLLYKGIKNVKDINDYLIENSFSNTRKQKTSSSNDTYTIPVVSFVLYDRCISRHLSFISSVMDRLYSYHGFESICLYDLHENNYEKCDIRFINWNDLASLGEAPFAYLEKAADIGLIITVSLAPVYNHDYMPEACVCLSSEKQVIKLYNNIELYNSQQTQQLLNSNQLCDLIVKTLS